MRIFGRKANQQSTTPGAPEVPPELQPYYGKPTLGSRLRRVGLSILPVIATLALVAALIAGGLWVKHRVDENNHKVATSQSTQKPATNNKGSSGTQNENSNQSPSNGSQPSSNPSNNSTSTNNANPTNGSASQQPTNSSTNNQTSPSNIPSTGPDPGMYLIALAMAIAGTAAAYVRQLKTARR